MKLTKDGNHFESLYDLRFHICLSISRSILSCKIYTFRDIVNVDLNEGHCNEFKQIVT
jgi:hypothetical protein